MLKTSQAIAKSVFFLSFMLFSTKVNAACETFPQVTWWGDISHESVNAYVIQKHGGDWSAYLEKWERQLGRVRDVHSKGNGIKIPSTGHIIKGIALGQYIGKLSQRVKINKCLADEMGTTDAANKKTEATTLKRVSPYAKGVAAYRAKNYKTAHDIWHPIAVAGNVKAQNALGHLHRKGLGVETNIEESRKWYGRSASSGDRVGQFSLGDIVRETAKTEKEMAQAIILLEKSAMQDYAPAQFTLGEIHKNGEGVPLNMAEAYFWTTLAVKNNYKKAKPLQENLEASISAEDKQKQTARVEKWLAEFNR